ncbi:MAG: high light inducible protein [Methylacidiphilales bacterium]|nr:high light inducible protein [Candidatus Methylacidiphilales bacterium]NJR17987.1 high light inducible protein [Calothrix sp. CSU_2_0]
MADTTTVKGNAVVAEDRNGWRWGFTPQAEIWNGRLAMIGFVAAAGIELFSGKGFLHFWGIL